MADPIRTVNASFLPDEIQDPTTSCGCRRSTPALRLRSLLCSSRCSGKKPIDTSGTAVVLLNHGLELGQITTTGRAGGKALSPGHREPSGGAPTRLVATGGVFSQYLWTISRTVAGVAVIITLFGTTPYFAFNPPLPSGTIQTSHAHRK